MLLAQIEPPSPWVQGDQILRTHQPCHALAAHHPELLVVAGTWLSPLIQDVAQWADVLVLVQAAWNDFLPLLARRQAHGLATVFEVNDNFRAIHAHTARGFWTDPGNQALIMQLAHRSDAAIYSSEGLVERYGWLSERGALFPNQLACVPPWRAAGWEAPEPLVIGWAGSGGHREDVEAAAQVLRRVHDACPNVQVAIMSQADILDIFADWPPARLRRVPAGGYRDYLRFLDGVHVGIAPLRPTEFNLCRSDVKVIEYAAHSVVPVVEDCITYSTAVAHGEDGLKVRGPVELEAALCALAEDPARARRLAHAAWAKVEAGRQEHQHAQRRWQLLEGAHAHAGGGQGPDAARSRARLMEAFRARPTSAERPHPRFWQVHFDPTESRLVELLNSPGAGGDTEAAREICRLAQSAPEHSVAQLLAGRCADDGAQAEAHLARAERLLPWGCEAAFSLAHRRRVAGDLEAAAGHYRRAALRAPAWGLPHEALAHLALGRGDVDAALGHLGDALDANPFNRRPAANLLALSHTHRRPRAAARLAPAAARVAPLVEAAEARAVGEALSRVHAPEALGYLEWAQQAHPEDAGIQALLARAYLTRGQPHRARRLLGAAALRAASASG